MSPMDFNALQIRTWTFMLLEKITLKPTITS